MKKSRIKQLLLGVLLMVLVLASVIVLRTLAFRSEQIEASPAHPLVLDEARVVQNLRRALQIRTVSEQDPARTSGEAFKQLHALLEASYPRVHATLKKQTVSEHSLLYRWAGKDPACKPILLLAHLDVVPAEEGSPWVYPPFSGQFADGFIWGRGALDDKSSVMGILEACEALLAEGFQPRRTIYLAFGHDEEIGGKNGASQIAALLQSQGVKAEFCLDEGLAVLEGIVPGVSKPTAMIGIAEKGYLTVELSVEGEGGHSSQPPRETMLGVLCAGVARLEANPLPARLRGPARQMLRTLGPEMSWPMRMVMANLWLFEGLVNRRLQAGRTTNAALRTTTAVTILNAGTKENILPTRAAALVNCRLLPGESIESVLDHIRRVVADDRIQVRIHGTPNAASPVADVGSPTYVTLNKTIRQVFPEAVVAPGLVLGATDSRHYTHVSEVIYRFGPLKLTEKDMPRIHGPNERIGKEDYLRCVRFFGQLIRNAAS